METVIFKFHNFVKHIAKTALNLIFRHFNHNRIFRDIIIKPNIHKIFHEIRSDNRAMRYINRHRLNILTCLNPAGNIFTDVSEHIKVYHMHRFVIFHCGNEIHRWNNRIVLIKISDKRLTAAKFSVDCGKSRLKPYNKSFFLYKLFQLFLCWEWHKCIIIKSVSCRLTVISVIIFLILIHFFIGNLYYFINIRRIFRIMKTNRHFILHFRNQISERSNLSCKLLIIRIIAKHDKFISADSVWTLLAERLNNHARYIFQCTITAAMTAFIVNLFQTVKVHIKHAQAAITIFHNPFGIFCKLISVI